MSSRMFANLIPELIQLEYDSGEKGKKTLVWVEKLKGYHEWTRMKDHEWTQMERLEGCSIDKTLRARIVESLRT